MPLSDNRALVVLVFNDREVQNRIIQLERYHSADELRRAANFLTERCRGKTLSAGARRHPARDARSARTMNALMKDAINVAEQCSRREDRPHGVRDRRRDQPHGFAGAVASTSCGGCSRHSTRSATSCNLLDQSLRADGVQIFIGQESGYRILDDVQHGHRALQRDNEVVGVIGVIGPTRMAYERVIPIVDVTAKILSRALARR